MGGRHHLDAAAGALEATVGAALDHARKALCHPFRAEMLPLDPHPPHRRRAARPPPRIDLPAAPLAGRPLARPVGVATEAPPLTAPPVPPAPPPPPPHHPPPPTR